MNVIRFSRPAGTLGACQSMVSSVYFQPLGVLTSIDGPVSESDVPEGTSVCTFQYGAVAGRRLPSALTDEIAAYCWSSSKFVPLPVIVRLSPEPDTVIVPCPAA